MKGSCPDNSCNEDQVSKESEDAERDIDRENVDSFFFFFLKGRCCFFVCVFFPIWPSHKLSHSYYATFKVFRSTTKFILWESYLLYFFLMSSTENTLVFITSYFEPSHFANNLELIQNIETRVWKGFTI